MNLKQTEKELLSEIEQMGLVRDVVHEEFEEPTTFSRTEVRYDIKGNIIEVSPIKRILDDGTEITIKHPRLYLGITWVRLYKKADWDKNRREDGTRFLGNFVAEGRANCSMLEGRYDRRKGRVIATARALKLLRKE